MGFLGTTIHPVSGAEKQANCGPWGRLYLACFQRHAGEFRWNAEGRFRNRGLGGDRSLDYPFWVPLFNGGGAVLSAPRPLRPKDLLLYFHAFCLYFAATWVYFGAFWVYFQAVYRHPHNALSGRTRPSKARVNDAKATTYRRNAELGLGPGEK